MAGIHEQTFLDPDQAILNDFQELCQKKKEENTVLADTKSKMSQQLLNRDKVILQLLIQDMMNERKILSLNIEKEQLLKASYDGTLSVEIPNYNQRKAEAVSGTPSFYSHDFYTDRPGYRMCTLIYLNGDGGGKGSHLSIFFALKKGRFDSYLSWPFQWRVTFTLLNQAGKDDLSDAFRPDPKSSSFQKPVKEINIASGFPMFVAHKVIENPGEGFMRNDMICLRVKVDPPLHK